MTRGMVHVIAGVALVAGLGAVRASAADRFPVSIGVTYGQWTPSLDAYNIRWSDQANNPSIIEYNGTGIPIYRRQPLQGIDTTTTIDWYTTGNQRFLFSSSSGIGFFARLRLHNEMFAQFEYDWWQQSVGSRRNFGGQWGYEGNSLKLNPVTVSLIYTMPTEGNSNWWPNLYFGAGAGAVLVQRTNQQITNTTPVGGGKTTSSGSGTVFTGTVGLEYVIPIPALDNRLSIFLEGRYFTGTYTEQFAQMGPQGSPLTDSTGAVLQTPESVSLQGPQVKAGMSLNFGQISARPEKGVLSGLIENRRRGGGYAMVPQYMGGAGTGMAMMYPQPQEQVQVVQGAGTIDEDRIRQIIREELLKTRVGTASTKPVNDLAEQQLRSIRERRLQAEQELKQLKQLLREEG